MLPVPLDGKGSRSMEITPQIIKTETKRLGKSLEALEGQLKTGAVAQSFAESFQNDMGLYQDFGYITESYDFLELLVESNSIQPGIEGWYIKELAQLFLAHMDLSRGKDRPRHISFYHEFKNHEHKFCPGSVCLE